MTSTINIETLKELRNRTSLSMGDCKKALTETDNNIEAAIDLLKKWGSLKSKAKASSIPAEGMVLAGVDHTSNTGVIVEVNSVTDFTSKTPEFQTFVQSFLDHLMFFSKASEINIIDKLRDALIQKTGENIVCRKNQFFSFDGAKRMYPVCYNHPGNKLASLVFLEVPDPKMKTDLKFIALAEDIAMQVAASDPMAANRNNIPDDLQMKQGEIFQGQLRQENKPEASWPKIIDGKFTKWYKECVLVEQLFVKDASKTVAQIIAAVDPGIKIVEFVRYGLGEGIETVKEDFGDEVAKMVNMS